MKMIQFLMLFLLYHPVQNARILGSVMFPSYSHHQVFNPIWKELANRGHELVILTANPMNDPTYKNIKEIDLSFTKDLWEKSQNFTNPPSPMQLFLRVVQTLHNISGTQLSHPKVQELIKNKDEHFDLFIVEWIWPTMYAFHKIFDCPMIGISTLGLTTSGFHAVGNPHHPILNPLYMLPFLDDMNFFERLFSVMCYVFFIFHNNFFVIPRMDKEIETYFGKGLPSVGEFQNNVSMLFLNQNPITSPHIPTVPTLVEFSGLTINKKRKELPEDIKIFLDNATEGAVYFSLGSNVKSNLLPLKLQIDIADCFSKLPYKFLWKYEDEILFHKPDNVKIVKWLPQQDVLDHLNIKLFITQGGIQSLEEAVYYKIPLVGMPFYADQPKNVRRMVQLGLGLSIDPKHFTKKKFKEIIVDVIENPKYRSTIENLSTIMTDQPIRPLDKVIYWIEYIIRHKGARHLRSPYADISWMKYLLLDVIFFIILVVTIIFYFLRWSLRSTNQKKKKE